MAVTSPNHAGMMDDIYRYQRLIYDATRKYYLLGRDKVINQIQPDENARILEMACGTGRNLDLIDKRYPGRQLYGLDISEQMLQTAREKLGKRALLKQGDACDFNSVELFGTETFDHIVMSYSLSMIPDWQGAITEAMRHLSVGGTLHLVDFGDQAKLPSLFKTALNKWLKQFHVTPREELYAFLQVIAERDTISLEHKNIFRHYAQTAKIEKLSPEK